MSKIIHSATTPAQAGPNDKAQRLARLFVPVRWSDLLGILFLLKWSLSQLSNPPELGGYQVEWLVRAALVRREEAARTAGQQYIREMRKRRANG